MSPGTNAGFRPQELSRRRFQEAAATTINKQAHAIQATREYMADLAVRLDKAEEWIVALDADRRRFEHMPWRARLMWVLRGR